jgi:raffinose/stachyose/melibiose transport system substrate-binding protein
MLKYSRLPAALTAVVVFLAFFGCSGRDAPATLRVLNYMDRSSPGSEEEIARLWDAFGEANPHITIIREDLYGESYHDRVEDSIHEGNLPDVIFAWPAGRSSILHTGGFLKDLSALTAKDRLKDSYAPAALDGSFQAGGYLALLPRSLSLTHVFYVNTAVLAAAGLSPAKTYDELKAQVAPLRAAGYETVILGNEDSWVMQQCLFSMLAARFCGPAWARRILSGDARFTDGDFTDALEFVRSLYADGVIARSTLLDDYRGMADRFMDNKAAYLVDGDWRVRELLAFPRERQGDIQLALFPEISGVALNRSASLIPGPGWGINARLPANSAEARAAWRLVRWLSGKEAQTWLLGAGDITTPSRLDVDEVALHLAPLEKAAAALVRRCETGSVTINEVFPAELCIPINDGLQELGMGTKTSGEVAQGIQTAFNAFSN